MGRPSRAGDDHADAARAGAFREIGDLFGGAMSGDDGDFGWDLEPFERFFAPLSSSESRSRFP